jgi:hypothetical protein
MIADLSVICHLDWPSERIGDACTRLGDGIAVAVLPISGWNEYFAGLR